MTTRHVREKKPSLEIYRPGALQSQRQEGTSAAADVTRSRKRPDKKLYVPKARREDGVLETSDRGEDVAVMDEPQTNSFSTNSHRDYRNDRQEFGNSGGASQWRNNSGMQRHGSNINTNSNDDNSESLTLRTKEYSSSALRDPQDLNSADGGNRSARHGGPPGKPQARKPVSSNGEQHYVNANGTGGKWNRPWENGTVEASSRGEMGHRAPAYVRRGSFDSRHCGDPPLSDSIEPPRTLPRNAGSGSSSARNRPRGSVQIDENVSKHVVENQPQLHGRETGKPKQGEQLPSLLDLKIRPPLVKTEDFGRRQDADRRKGSIQRSDELARPYSRDDSRRKQRGPTTAGRGGSRLDSLQKRRPRIERMEQARREDEERDVDSPRPKDLGIPVCNGMEESSEEDLPATISGTIVVKSSTAVATEEGGQDWKEAFKEYSRAKSPEAGNEPFDDTLFRLPPEPLDWSLEVEKAGNEQVEKQAAAQHRQTVPDPATATRPVATISPAKGSGGLLHVSAAAIEEANRRDQMQRNRSGHRRVTDEGWNGAQTGPPDRQRMRQRQDYRQEMPSGGGGQYNDYSASAPNPQPYNPLAPDKMPVADVLREINHLDRDISGFLGHLKQGDLQQYDAIMHLRLRSQLLYRRLVVQQLELSHQQQLEQILWKNNFYRIIEILRSLVPTNHYVQPMLTQFIQQGAEFYEMLLSDLQRQHQFSLHDQLRPIDDELSIACTAKPYLTSRSHKFALLAAQRCCLALGDLERYRQQAIQQTNFGKARSWYLKAIQLSPKNGRPYNQLALLAVYTRRRLEAVYYYMRALAAHHSFATAAQSLIQVFEEVHKKYEFYEEQVRAEYERCLRESGMRNKRDQQRRRIERPTIRRETWISPEGRRETDTEEEEINSLEPPGPEDLLLRCSTGELNKRFLTYFLELSGMLFCKLNLEKLNTVCERAFMQLQALLSRTQSPLTPLQLVQVMSIALFCVHVISSREFEPNSLLVLQQQALQVLLGLAGLLLERLKSVLADWSTSLGQPTSDGEAEAMTQAHLLLPSLRTWCRWMEACAEQYKDVPQLEAIQLPKVKVDVWDCLASVCNKLVDEEGKLVPDCDGVDMVDVVLPEDILNAGFTSNFPAQFGERFQLPKARTDRHACDQLRLRLMLDVGQFFDGIDMPGFRFDPDLDNFVASSSPPGSPGPAMHMRLRASESSEDLISGNESSLKDDSFEGDEALSGQFQQLRLHKKEEQMRQKAMQQEEGRVVELEVCPSFLIADTNTWLDHFPILKRTIALGKYTVIVPFIVVTELSGLGKRKEEEWVSRQASEVLGWLHSQFDAGVPKIKAATTSGQLLEGIRYGYDDGEHCSNDDKILKCCTSFCDDSSRDVIINLKDQPLHLKRKIVLITDDRNLRLKAMSANVPTKTMPKFARWARIS